MGLLDFLSGDEQGPRQPQPTSNPFVSPQPRAPRTYGNGNANTAGTAPWQFPNNAPFGGQSSSPSFPTPSSTPFSNPIPNRSATGSGPRFIKRATDEEVREAWPEAIRRYQLQTMQGDPNSPQIDNSLVPRVTSEQHKAFNSIKYLPIHGRRIYGEPGSGLGESDFGQERVRSGTAGEQIFAKLLSRDGILDRCVSFWSLSRPTEDGERDDSGADIDCVLLIDNHLLLIDVKNYRAGLAYHTLIPDKAMFCVYPAARVVAKEPYIFSVNMNWARNNLHDYLDARCPNLIIDTFVVLVPGESGEATLDADITWPGGIPAYSYSTFLTIVNRMLPANQGFVRRTPLEGFLASMVKYYTCTSIDPTAPVNENAWPTPTFDADRGIDQLNKGKSSGSHGKGGKSSSSRGSSASGRSGSKPHRTTKESSPSQPSSSSSSGASGSSRSSSKRSTENHPFGGSRTSPLPKGWGSDDLDDDDDWVPPSKMPKSKPQPTPKTTPVSSPTGVAGDTRRSARSTSGSTPTRTMPTRSTPTRWDPFARPDEQPAHATTASVSRDAGGQSRYVTAHSASGTPASASKKASKSTARKTNRQLTLDQVPQVNVASLSYVCGVTPDMTPVTLSLRDVSGMVAAGISGMGEITHMLFMATLLAKQAGVFVRLIDCKDTTYLDGYKPAFATLVHRSQGLEAILKEVQTVKGLVDTRSFLVRRLSPNGGYWSLDTARRLKPLMLFMHECGNLFSPDPNNEYVSKDDLKMIDSIKLMLRQIIERGREAGVIVVLSTQQPNHDSLPKSLVDVCQTRLCFGAVEPAVSTAIFGDRFAINDNPTAKLERSHAVISTPENTIPDVHFYTIAKSVTEQLLTEVSQA